MDPFAACGRRVRRAGLPPLIEGDSARHLDARALA
jgi:hypothetical protein